MKQLGIKAHYRKKVTQTTVSSDFTSKLKNVLNRQFNPSDPNSVWVSDITYIWSEHGFVYLTSIMDLYSRKIIAWELSETLSVEGILSCINKTKRTRNFSNPVIIHSDRGTQYVSNDYKSNLGYGFVLSYSNKGNPWDNACIESFHALIKREWLSKYYFKNINSVRRAVFEYIDVFYNRKRIHSTIGYQTPIQYEISYNLSSKSKTLSLNCPIS